MKYNAVKKVSIIIGIGFIVLSLIEVIFLLIMASTLLTVNGQSMTLLEFLLDVNFAPIFGVILWDLILFLTCFYLVLGLLICLLVIKKEESDGRIIAKFLVIVGMFVLILAFVKLEYIVILTDLALNFKVGATAITFKTLIFDQTITPISVPLMWIFLTAVVCYCFVTGLVLAASGLKWTLEFEREDAAKKEAEQESKK